MRLIWADVVKLRNTATAVIRHGFRIIDLGSLLPVRIHFVEALHLAY